MIEQKGKTRQGLHAPADYGRCGVSISHALERGVRSAHVPVIVVAFDGHRRGV